MSDYPWVSGNFYVKACQFYKCVSLLSCLETTHTFINIIFNETQKSMNGLLKIILTFQQQIPKYK